MLHVGVDGCKAGWLAVTRSGLDLDYAICTNIGEVVNAFPKALRILIDVPIGLPWPGVPMRPCDELARSLLGRPRGSSVFPVPCREALAASDVDEARAINKERLGR